MDFLKISFVLQNTKKLISKVECFSKIEQKKPKYTNTQNCKFYLVFKAAVIYLCIINLGSSITVLSTLRLKWPSTKKSKSSPEWRRAAHCSRMASTQMDMVSRGVEAEKTCFSMRSRNLVTQYIFKDSKHVTSLTYNPL